MDSLQHNKTNKSVTNSSHVESQLTNPAANQPTNLLKLTPQMKHGIILKWTFQNQHGAILQWTFWKQYGIL